MIYLKIITIMSACAVILVIWIVTGSEDEDNEPPTFI